MASLAVEIEMMKGQEDVTAAAAVADDKVSEAANDSLGFPDDDDNEEQTLQWREVPQHTWLRIVDRRKIIMEDRVATILTLLRRDGKTYTAWTTGIIAKGIEKKIQAQQTEEDRPEKLYIRSLGKTNSKINPAYSYYNYNLKST